MFRLIYPLKHRLVYFIPSRLESVRTEETGTGEWKNIIVRENISDQIIRSAGGNMQTDWINDSVKEIETEK